MTVAVDDSVVGSWPFGNDMGDFCEVLPHGFPIV
jgi:hypothetical protein